MTTQVIEVDDDVFQITTEHDDGSVTVETVHGRDAYDHHFTLNTQRNTHNEYGIRYAYAAGRKAAGSGNAWMWHH